MAIRGILPVIPTPLRDGRFDESSFQRMLDHMLPQVDGYTLLGSTGEAPSLSLDERMEIAEIALGLTPRDKQVVVGVAHTSTREAVRLADHAQQRGAAAVLAPVPYYFTNTAGGILRYLSELNAALAIELVLYDNPVATGTRLLADQVLTYAGQLSQLTAVKLTDHDLTKIGIWQQAGLTVLAGDDPILFRYLAAGVDGAMVIAPLLCPAAFRRVWDLVKDDDLLGALRVFGAEILPVLHVFGIGDEIATTKALLLELGVFAADELRPPLEPVSAERREVLRLALQAIAAIGTA